MSNRFYVYRLYDDPAVTLYVGKGSGSRFKSQMRAHHSQGEILRWFDDERAAFAHEIKMIADHKPALNKHVGGAGGRIGKRIRFSKEEVGFIAEGPRRFTARMLLKFDLRQYLNASEIGKIRQVACGDWC